MKKKAIVLSSFLRLIIAFLILFFLIGCGNMLYAFFFGSEASESYDELLNLIQTLQYDESKPYYLYLDNENAIIGFNKSSDKINYVAEKWKSYFERPDIETCKKDFACLCLCRGKFQQKETLDFGTAQLECKGKLECNPIVILDFPAEIKSEEIGEDISAVDTNYVFNGGFYIGRSNSIKKYIPTFSSSPPKVIYVKKDRDNSIHISTKPFDISSEE